MIASRASRYVYALSESFLDILYINVIKPLISNSQRTFCFTQCIEFIWVLILNPKQLGCWFNSECNGIYPMTPPPTPFQWSLLHIKTPIHRPPCFAMVCMCISMIMSQISSPPNTWDESWSHRFVCETCTPSVSLSSPDVEIPDTQVLVKQCTSKAYSPEENHPKLECVT